MKPSLTEEQANDVFRTSPEGVRSSLKAGALGLVASLLLLVITWLAGLDPMFFWLAGFAAALAIVAVSLAASRKRNLHRAALLRDMFNHHWRDVTATRDSLSGSRFYYFSNTEKAAGKTLSIQREVTLSRRELERFESHLPQTQP